MQNVAAETGDRSHESTPSSENQITLVTLLVIVAAIAAECALVVQIRKNYTAIPPSAAPVYAEVYVTPVVLLWIILGSTAVFAWRRHSVTRLAAHIAISCTLVLSRLWVPTGVGAGGEGFDVLWPATCFGVFFVAPLLLRRFSRIGDSVLTVADSAGVALLTYLFAVEPYVPMM
jgi:hypothetical protein